MFPVLVLTLTLKAEVGVTDAVICELGTVATVHWVEGITAPIMPVEVLLLTEKALVGVTEAVICELGIVVTVH